MNDFCPFLEAAVVIRISRPGADADRVFAAMLELRLLGTSGVPSSGLMT